MSFNLLDSVQVLFGNDLIGKVSSMLGESEGSVQKAVSGLVPSVLAGILHKAGSGDAGGVLDLAKNAAGSGILSNLGNFGGNSSLLSKGADMLKDLFGENTNNVSSAIASFSGIKTSSAASLLSIAAPAALGMLGQHINATQMTSGGLLSFLNSQKDRILGALPPGLNLASALGLDSMGAIGSKLTGALSGLSGGAKHLAHETADSAKSGTRWLLPLIGAIAAILIIWLIIRGCSPNTTQAVVSTDTVATPAMPAMHESIKVKLPNGVELDAYKDGIEDQLVAFLKDSSKTPDNNTWFDFDNLNFATGSATITPESDKQVGNITAILKAFPTAAIKIGGYTDKTGDSLINLKLSQSRADAVLSALKTAGSDPAQLVGAQGYGSQFAKAAADAPDADRVTDRRIAVSVRKK
jgi:outer membrane protein OmpA-like peptidoglycan-associated protein